MEIKYLLYALILFLSWDRAFAGRHGCVTLTDEEESERAKASGMGHAENGFGNFVYKDSELMEKFKAKLAREYPRDGKNPKLMVIGPGHADNLIDIMARGEYSEITFVELGSEQVKVMQRRFKDCPHINFIEAKFPFDEQQKKKLGKDFGNHDEVLMSHVIHYLDGEERREAGRQMLDYLKEGGEVFIQGITTSSLAFADELTQYLTPPSCHGTESDEEVAPGSEDWHFDRFQDYYVQELKIFTQKDPYLLNQKTFPNEILIAASRANMRIERELLQLMKYKGHSIPRLNGNIPSATYPAFAQEMEDIMKVTLKMETKWLGYSGHSYADEKKALAELWKSKKGKQSLLDGSFPLSTDSDGSMPVVGGIFKKPASPASQ